MLVLHAALVVAHTFEYSDPFLGREHTSVDGRVREPQDDTDPDKDGKTAEEYVNDLVRRDAMAVVEGDPVCDEAAEDLCQSYFVRVSS